VKTEEQSSAAPEPEKSQESRIPENQEQGQADEQQPDAEQEAILAELAELRKQAEENYQKLLRSQADFDNFRRRSRQEREELAKYASLKLIEQLLPVVDNFDRALSSSKETKDFESLAKGVEMIWRQLDQVLSQEGLKPMETVGQPFNPEYHQAVAQVESEEHEEGIIVEELQKGYMLKDKVLRPAMVKVSK
jgi:molecular chaperone GrpE